MPTQRCSWTAAAALLVALASAQCAFAADDPASRSATVEDGATIELPGALFGDDATARTAALESLKRIPHQAVAALLQVLIEDESERRERAGEALVEIVPRDARAAELIAQAIEGLRPGTRVDYFGERALNKIGLPAIPAALRYGRGDLAYSIAEPGDAATVAAVIELIEKRDAAAEGGDDADPAASSGETGEVAAQDAFGRPGVEADTELLLKLGPAQSVAALGKALDRNPKSNGLFEAAYWLAGRNATGLIAGLVKQFDSPSKERRVQAAEALARIGKPAVPALVKALAKPEHRTLALAAIERLGPEAGEAVETLRPLIAADAMVTPVEFPESAFAPISEPPPVPLHQLVLAALEAIGPAAGVAADDILKHELSHPDRKSDSTRWAFALGPKAVRFLPPIADFLSDEATSRRIQAECDSLRLEEYYRNKPLSEIRERAKYNDFKLRQVEALAWSKVNPKDERLRERFFVLLSQGNALVDEPGCGAWPNLKDIAPIALAAPDAYRGELQQMLDEKGDGRIKSLYLLALIDPDSPDVHRRVLAAAKDKDEAFRHAAITALAESRGNAPETIIALAKCSILSVPDEADGVDFSSMAAKEGFVRRGAAIKQVLPQLRKLAMATDQEGKLSDDQLWLLRVIAPWDRLDGEAARLLATGLQQGLDGDRQETALALSRSAAAPELVLPMFSAAIEEGHKAHDPNNAFSFRHSAEYVTAIGRYGPAARARQAMLLKLAVKEVKPDSDDADSEEQADADGKLPEGKPRLELEYDPFAVEVLVALGRIGPAVDAATLDTLRIAKALFNSECLARDVAVWRIGGEKNADDAARIINTLRRARPEDLSPSLCEELVVFGKQHREVLPLLRTLLTIDQWLFCASWPDRWPAFGTDKRAAIGERIVKLGNCIAALSPGDEQARKLLCDALAWEMSGHAANMEPRVGMIELLTALGDRSAEFRGLAERAAQERYWPAIRYAASEALRRMDK